jgi:hypothetical protein
MPPAPKSTRVNLHIDTEPDADERDLQELTVQLRQELEELSSVESVDLARKREVPERTKPVDPIAWGDIILALAASGGVITTLINMLQNWLTRHERVSVSIEIGGDKLQLSGVPSDQQQLLVENWIQAHTKGRTDAA